MESHHATAVTCDKCSKTFGSAKSHQQHLDDSVHCRPVIPATVFSCTTCRRTFEEESTFESHIESDKHDRMVELIAAMENLMGDDDTPESSVSG